MLSAMRLYEDFEIKNRVADQARPIRTRQIASQFSEGTGRVPRARRCRGSCGVAASAGHGRRRRFRARVAGPAGLAGAARPLAGGGGELLSRHAAPCPTPPLTLLKTLVTLALYCKPLSAVFGFVLFRGFFFFFPFLLFPPSFLLNPLSVISEVRAGRAESWKFAGAFLEGFFHPVGPVFMICA